MTASLRTALEGARARPRPLLAVRDLRVEFRYGRSRVGVVDGASFEIGPGEARGLVGESGSGKTVTALSIMGLLPRGRAIVTGGEIEFDGRRLDRMSPRDLRSLRGREVAMIFQEPMTSLNPAFTVGNQIAEAVHRHRGMGRRESWKRAVEMLELVGIPAPERRAKEYPHSFSGGMRQRVMIAMAVACGPKLLIADEPTTALDVTIQASILDLLRSLREELGLAVLLVTHDLGVVADFCEQMTVLYAGQTVETGSTREVLGGPLHPYTGGLLASMPRPEHLGGDLAVIPGQVPHPGLMPSGCRFHPRCPHYGPGTCDGGEPALQSVDRGRATRCVRVQRGEAVDPASGFGPAPTSLARSRGEDRL